MLRIYFDFTTGQQRDIEELRARLNTEYRDIYPALISFDDQLRYMLLRAIEERLSLLRNIQKDAA